MNDNSAPLPPPRKLHTASWVIYDLANTVFAATVTFLFATQPHIDAARFGITTSMAMILAGLATPFVASLADRTGRAGMYCSVATLGCIAAMACFGVFSSATALLAAFFVATVFYQSALVFYNSLLLSVSTEKNMGLVSGLGVGLGYMGTIFTLVIAMPFKQRFGLGPAFFLTAGVFLICALPCMLLVRDRRPIEGERFSWGLARCQAGELLDTLRRLPQRRALMWFLIGNFFAVDVLNTSIFFYGKFIRGCFESMADAGELALFGRVIHNIDTFIMIGGLAVNVPALGFGLLLGYLSDRMGARKIFGISIGCLAGGLAGAALFGGRSPLLFLIAICCFGGLGLAGIWTAGRKLLTELVPREQVARYFGLYGITTKVSVIGSTVFGLIMVKFGPRLALLSQVGPLLFALLCLHFMVKAGNGKPPRQPD